MATGIQELWGKYQAPDQSHLSIQIQNSSTSIQYPSKRCKYQTTIAVSSIDHCKYQTIIASIQYQYRSNKFLFTHRQYQVSSIVKKTNCSYLSSLKSYGLESGIFELLTKKYLLGVNIKSFKLKLQIIFFKSVQDCVSQISVHENENLLYVLNSVTCHMSCVHEKVKPNKAKAKSSIPVAHEKCPWKVKA